MPNVGSDGHEHTHVHHRHRVIDTGLCSGGLRTRAASLEYSPTQPRKLVRAQCTHCYIIYRG